MREVLGSMVTIICGLICMGCAVCVMNGNKGASTLGLISLAVLVIAVIVDERRKK